VKEYNSLSAWNGRGGDGTAYLFKSLRAFLDNHNNGYPEDQLSNLEDIKAWIENDGFYGNSTTELVNDYLTSVDTDRMWEDFVIK
jgi:hypothetical protein